MKRIIWIYGLISAAIAALNLAWVTIAFKDEAKTGAIDFGGLEWLGWVTLILAYLVIYFAQASYRDNYSGGTITYGKAFKIGLFITLLSAAVYALVWVFIVWNVFPNFMETFSAMQIEKMKASGKSAEDIAKTTREFSTYIELYKNPFFVWGFTFLTEPLPVGLAATLISSFIVKLKKGKPQTAVRA
ncbi:MAG: DUF4199 domain-containing protein [Sphingobacteriales bacterium]|nr:MAG: DUF4199 domain-containing protein [Sphingobacteriales bacterium]